MPEIIKVKLINRHPNDTLAGSLELKKSVNWPRIFLIRLTFDSLQHSIKCLF